MEFVSLREHYSLLFVRLWPVPGMVNHINRSWAQAFPDEPHPLIGTREWIEAQLQFMRSDPEHIFATLAPRMVTVDDWNEFCRGRQWYAYENFGIATMDASDRGDPSHDDLQRIRARLEWLRDNAGLFTSIRGIDEVVNSYGLLGIPETGYTDGKPVYRHNAFAYLAEEPKSKVYQLCVEFNQADVWDAYIQFREKPCALTWDALRHIPILWKSSTLDGLYRQELDRAGIKYQANRIPDEFTLRRLLRQVDSDRVKLLAED